MLIDPMDVAGKSLLSVDEAAKQEPARRALERDNLDTVLRYHRETKHHFSHFARGPGHLDWANQPDPFRRYEGASLTFLPRLNPGDAPVSPRYEDLYRPGAIPSASLSACSLSRLFEYALAISAWKQAGDVRWALRTNPSSGNLHRSEERRVGKECRSLRDWSSDVCSSDLPFCLGSTPATRRFRPGMRICTDLAPSRALR